ncbi:hypothetical protein P5837_28820 [Bacillus cereus]|uniref:hypothetical protein n=1 Tax=Bacillus cereus TaxID=1396 RepID=UPI001D0E91EF|nr:hypothetical protein [Bacillus cereus]MCC2370349.1 hypothetical protein [Bacillus cereus]MCC2491391.1 hypothetical protein [Bacillus cereus]MDF9457544.1 hypothetical protein [Bacillus cereus]MDF9644952.1 hypothetical protein [Bacillus cereus]
MNLDTVIETWFNLYLTFCIIHALWYKDTVLSNEIALQKYLSQDELMKSKSFWRKKKKYRK